jgi:hypothetical protein
MTGFLYSSDTTKHEGPGPASTATVGRGPFSVNPPLNVQLHV